MSGTIPFESISRLEKLGTYPLSIRDVRILPVRYCQRLIGEFGLPFFATPENLSLGGNAFTGDATSFCEDIGSTSVRHFTADCAYSFLKSSEPAETPAAVVCPCCTRCMK